MKNLSRVLPALVLLSMSNVCANTNKTFLMPRPQGANLPLEQTTFMELINRKNNKKFGGNLALTGFYQHSEAKDDLSKYFLVKEKSTIDLRAKPTDGINSNKTSSINDVDITYFLHSWNSNQDVANDINNLKTSLTLAPEQTVWAAQIDYNQDLHAILHGLFAYAHMPITYVQNKVQLNVKGADAELNKKIVNVFNGTYQPGVGDDPDNNKTTYLTNAKMVGRKSAIGIADIDLALGYKFLNQERYNAAIAIALTIPTGNKAKGEYLFEPIYGNGDHFALGGDLNGQARLCGNFEHNLKVNIAGKYRYLFEHNEQRTLGIKGREFGQYFLLGHVGQATLVPAANVLTLPVDVTPGSQFDGIAGITYNYRGFTADLGYNLYYRESEKVSMRTIFPDKTYAIAARGFDTAAAFTLTAPNVDGGDVAAATINNDTIDAKAAATPEQWTNGIYGSLGYISKCCENPWMLGVGGKYEFADHNSALEQWGVWLKAGIGF